MPRNPQDPWSAAAFCRYTAQALEAHVDCVQWGWVPSHSNIAGNEIVDSLARACAADVFPSSWISADAFEFLQSPSTPWLWRFFSASQACPSVEYLSRGQHEPTDPCPTHLVRQPTSVDTPDTRASLDVTWCSFNDQTLKDSKQVLLAQLQAVPCHVVALQETRACHSSTIHGADFIEFHSAAQKRAMVGSLFSFRGAIHMACPSSRDCSSRSSILLVFWLPAGFLGFESRPRFFRQPSLPPMPLTLAGRSLRCNNGGSSFASKYPPRLLTSSLCLLMAMLAWGPSYLRALARTLHRKSVREAAACEALPSSVHFGLPPLSLTRRGKRVSPQLSLHGFLAMARHHASISS